jgi:hypothetical protein
MTLTQFKPMNLVRRRTKTADYLHRAAIEITHLHTSETNNEPSDKEYYNNIFQNDERKHIQHRVRCSVCLMEKRLLFQ